MSLIVLCFKVLLKLWSFGKIDTKLFQRRRRIVWLKNKATISVLLCLLIMFFFSFSLFAWLGYNVTWSNDPPFPCFGDEIMISDFSDDDPQSIHESFFRSFICLLNVSWNFSHFRGSFLLLLNWIFLFNDYIFYFFCLSTRSLLLSFSKCLYRGDCEGITSRCFTIEFEWDNRVLINRDFLLLDPRHIFIKLINCVTEPSYSPRRINIFIADDDQMRDAR